MEKRKCIYFNSCFSSGEGCIIHANEKHDCDELERRNKLNAELCPIMVATGYKNNLLCNIPEIRSLVPVGLECNPNGQCIVTMLSQEIKDIVIKINKNGDNAKLDRGDLIKILDSFKKITCKAG